MLLSTIRSERNFTPKECFSSQELDETVLENGGAANAKATPRYTRSSSRDLPTLGGSPTGPFKRPKAPSVSKPSRGPSRGESSQSTPEARRTPENDTQDTETPSLDPIACSTLRLSDATPPLSLASLEGPEAQDSVIFSSAVARRPLSPLSGNGSKPPIPPKKGFKFAAPVERRKDERRLLPAFSCFECQEVSGERIFNQISFFAERKLTSTASR